ncbi:hypothetical protein BBP40_000610 [Aspergillus hancockii]|nr:hypothetical protein BBP40_000610 [Aspergillus hancockii]
MPAIFGTNANEEACLVTWAGPDGPNMTYVHEKTVSGQLCPANYKGRLRCNTGALSFRYFDKANFSNISPRPWGGACHTSELPLLFGTYSQYGSAAVRQLYWKRRFLSDGRTCTYLTFFRDPINGLPAMAWLAFVPGGDTMTSGNDSVSRLLPIKDLDDEYISATGSPYLI